MPKLIGQRQARRKIKRLIQDETSRINSALNGQPATVLRYRNQDLGKKDSTSCSTSVNLKSGDEFNEFYEDSVTKFGCNSSYGSSSFDEVLPDSNEFRADSLRDSISKWVAENRITQKATNELISILTRHSLTTKLPKDYRTLLQTPRDTPTRIVKPGIYAHFGLIAGLIKSLRNCAQELPELLDLQFNIDELPLFKSSNKQFWPILCSTVNAESSPFIVGIYCGNSKPDSVNDFLSKFISELNEGLLTGLIYNNTLISIGKSSFVCDAQARAYIAQIKGHNGKSGCGKCTVQGRRIENRVMFLESNSALRTDASYRARTDDDHHHGISPLEQLPIDMVDDFPYEFMHLVCLGVMRKLINLWIRGSIQVYRMSSTKIDEVSARLFKFSRTMCCEFNRKPRSLREVDRWKATEFRQFLLYTGAAALDGILDRNHYDLFLSFSTAISILVNPKLYYTQNEYADSLLRYFVLKFEELYGKTYVSYNVHGLIHLAKDSRRFGPLDKLSCFKFENELGSLKRLVIAPNNLLQQVHRRITEIDDFNTAPKPHKYSCRNKHCDGPVLPNISFHKQFKSATINNFELKLSKGNNWCTLQNNEIVLVKNICSFQSNEKLILGKEIRKKSDFFNVPMQSSLIDIYESDGMLSDLKCWPLTLVKSKLQVLELKNSYDLARIKLISAQETSDLSENSSNQKRKRTKKKLIYSDDDAPPRKKHFRPTHLSVPPEPPSSFKRVIMANENNFRAPRPTSKLNTGEALSQCVLVNSPQENMVSNESPNREYFSNHTNMTFTSHQLLPGHLNIDLSVLNMSVEHSGKEFEENNSARNEQLLNSFTKNYESETVEQINNVTNLEMLDISNNMPQSSSTRGPMYESTTLTPQNINQHDFSELTKGLRKLQLTLDCVTCSMLRQEACIQQLAVKVDNMSDAVLSLGSIHHPSLDTVELPKFPFHSVEDFQSFDSTLSSNEELKKKLVSYLVSIGGNSSEDAIRRVLGRLMTDGLCKMYTWHGTKEKFAFKALHFTRLMLESLNQNPRTKTNATEKIIEESVRSWFKHTNDRDNIKTKRNTVQQNKNQDCASNGGDTMQGFEEDHTM